MAKRGNLGICALGDIAGLNEPPGTFHAGFIFGPRVNAGGRIGASDLGARLLSSDDHAEVQMLARRGIRPMCILIDPTSFGVQASTTPLMAALQAARIPLLIVRKDDNITLALAQRPV